METNAQSLTRALEAVQGRQVLIVGDIMLDHYLIGKVDRISPEAPVPVVLVKEERHLLGGAGNVARNILGLGGVPLLVGLCGEDPDGALLRSLLAEEGVRAELVADQGRRTTKKTRIMAHNQQVVRVDMEMPTPALGAVLDNVLAAVQGLLGNAAVVVVSDYGKGMVSAEFMRRLLAMADSMSPRPRILVDPKVRNFPLYAGVDLLTPNTREAAESAGLPVEDHLGVLRAGLAIFKALRNRHLLITLGPDGMALFESPGQVWHIPTAARKVFDVTGAGDTVIATVALAMAAGLDLLTACKLANCAAGLVVAEVGAAAAQRDKLAQALGEYTGSDIRPWLEENRPGQAAEKPRPA